MRDGRDTVGVTDGSLAQEDGSVNERVWNFSPGPATLPPQVLEQAGERVRSLPGAGASILEVSHRSTAFEAILDEAESNLRDLLEVPDEHRVLFLQGGASLQFSMAPMNLLRGSGRTAAYVVTGSWGEKAVAEARKEGDVVVVWDGGPSGYSSVPDLAQVNIADDSAYLHVTSNETIQGVELPVGSEPSAGPFLVADASSDFLSRPIPLERYGLLYAGAQKNAGPAGLTIAIIREDVLARIPARLPSMLDYRTYAEHRSLYNTPPVFAIDVLMLVTRWIRDEVGGLDKMHERNGEKAALVYEAIDTSDGFYRGHARAEARSLMNVTFRLPDETLDAAFVSEAAANGLLELKGHRSVGGIRASIYNAMPLEGVRTLRAFMDYFRLWNS
jgi:phosphoserine aminotransferase